MFVRIGVGDVDEFRLHWHLDWLLEGTYVCNNPLRRQCIHQKGALPSLHVGLPCSTIYSKMQRRRAHPKAWVLETQISNIVTLYYGACRLATGGRVCMQ